MEDVKVIKRSRIKIIAASVILLGGMVFLVVAMTKSTSMRHFTPAALLAAGDDAHDQRVQVDGLIAEGSSKWDVADFKLTFAIQDRETEATVNVIYDDGIKPDNFKDGGSVFVEGRYDAAQHLVIATKVMTKCASKYEGAESTVSTDETSYVSE